MYEARSLSSSRGSNKLAAGQTCIKELLRQLAISVEQLEAENALLRGVSSLGGKQSPPQMTNSDSQMANLDSLWRLDGDLQKHPKKEVNMVPPCPTPASGDALVLPCSHSSNTNGSELSVAADSEGNGALPKINSKWVQSLMSLSPRAMRLPRRGNAERGPKVKASPTTSSSRGMRGMSKDAEEFMINAVHVQPQPSTRTPDGQNSQWFALISKWFERQIAEIKVLLDVKEPQPTGILSSFVLSNTFELICLLVITIDAVVTVQAVNHEMATWEETESSKSGWRNELLFVVFYIIEMTLRVYVHRANFLFGKDLLWNLFDVLLVVAAILDALGDINEQFSLPRSITFLRVLRTLRISRMLMMVRSVRCVRELRLLVVSLVGCVGPTLVWSMIMLSFLLVIFGLFFLQGMTDYLKYNKVDYETRQRIEEHFGSVGICMLTLWKASTGGEDWGQFYELIKPTGRIAFLYIFFIWFFQGAIFNVMTGIFCEKALTAAMPTRQERLQQEMEDDELQKQDLHNLCDKLDADGDGNISIKEFKDFMGDKEFMKSLSLYGLNVKNPDAFFETVSVAVGGKERIALHDFLGACMQLKGQAAAVDVHMLGIEMLHMQRNQHQFHVQCRESFQELQTQLSSLQIGGLRSRISSEALSDGLLSCAPDDSTRLAANGQRVFDLQLPLRL